MIIFYFIVDIINLRTGLSLKTTPSLNHLDGIREKKYILKLNSLVAYKVLDKGFKLNINSYLFQIIL